MEPEKRRLRQMKRAIKKAGQKSRRQSLKRDLANNPEDAAYTEESFGRNSSAGLNGLDNDATRRRSDPPEPAGADE
jgi:hypothetical protein